MLVIRYFNKLHQFLQLGGRIGSHTLTSSQVATEKELWSGESEGISKEICPLEECNNYSYLQILLICSSFSSNSDSGTQIEDQRLSALS